MATETLNLNLNEANPPEESPIRSLDPPATTGLDLTQDPADLSAKPLSSTVNGGEDASQKEVDGSNGTDVVSEEAPAGALPGSAAPDSEVQKKMRRAERFGMPVKLSEAEKRNSRAERFGTAPTVHGSDAPKKADASKKSEVSDASKKAEEMKRKARAERFGLPVPSEATDEEAKKKARVGRFAPPPKVDSVEEDKRKARALRFSEAPSSSVPVANGKGNVEPKAAIAGKAIGGA